MPHPFSVSSSTFYKITETNLNAISLTIQDDISSSCLLRTGADQGFYMPRDAGPPSGASLSERFFGVCAVRVYRRVPNLSDALSSMKRTLDAEDCARVGLPAIGRAKTKRTI